MDLCITLLWSRKCKSESVSDERSPYCSVWLLVDAYMIKNCRNCQSLECYGEDSLNEGSRKLEKAIEDLTIIGRRF